MKILLWNTGYGRGYTGSIFDYLQYPLRLLRTPIETETTVLEALCGLVRTEAPEILFLPEVSLGRQFRAIRAVLAEEYPTIQGMSKYHPQSIFPHLPFHRRNGNALLLRSAHPTRTWYLQHGTKRLVYEATLPDDTCILMVHLSLNRKTRKRQWEELGGYAKGKKRVILMGDCNTLGGTSEIAELLEGTNLHWVTSSPTFPVSRPRLPLDLFLLSKGIQGTVRVCNVAGSDHFPVVLEIEDLG